MQADNRTIQVCNIVLYTLTHCHTDMASLTTSPYFSLKLTCVAKLIHADELFIHRAQQINDSELGDHVQMYIACSADS